MSNKTVLNVKIDKDLKEQAQATAKSMGLPVSIVVSASLKEFVKTRSITINDEGELKPEVIKELLQISKDAKAGKNISPEFDNLEDSFIWLDKEVAKERKNLKK